MTGPEHYREAEQARAAAEIAAGQFEEHGWSSKQILAALLYADAQVHATLALAAATALRSDLHDDDWDEWRKAAAVTP